jgi:hypothetical protein
MTTGTPRRPIASRSLAVILVVLSFSLLLVVGDPGVARAADPGPIPAGLWDTDPGVPAGTSYIAMRTEPAGSSSGTTVPGDGAEIIERTYTKANASIELRETAGRIGFEIWQGGRKFLWLSAVDWSTLTPGFHEPARVDWSSCAVDAQAWIAVDEIERGSAGIESLTLRYGQHCAGDGSTVFGKVHWDASDATAPPGPTSIPDDLWDMPAPVDAGRSYIPLDGPVDEGPSSWRGDRLYTRENALLSVGLEGTSLGVSIRGDEDSVGQFVTMSSLDTLQPGYYGDLGDPGLDPALGGLEWRGEGQGCSDASGWFAVDDVHLGPSGLETVTLRFGLTCADGGWLLHGKLHFDAADDSTPPGVLEPIPDDLWDIDPAVAPGQTYVAIEGAPGNALIGDQTLVVTKADAAISVSESAPRVRVRVEGDEDWNGDFEPMSPLTGLVEGFYPSAQDASSGNPTRPGVDWSGMHRACSVTDGWIAVDEIVRSGPAVTALTLRFHQVCDGMEFHGKVRWIAADTTEPPGPEVPVPSDLWDTNPSVASGQSYLALESPVGDPVGNGISELSTKADSVMSVYESGGRVVLSVKEDEVWSGTFTPMSSIDEVGIGYYGELVSEGNPAKGSLAWRSDRRHCNWATGWFAVDEVTRTNGSLSTLTLRFEQSCEDGPALHGKIRWSAADTTVPPGPENPVPGDLWDSTPDVGADQSFLALEGDAGGPLAGAPHELYTKANSLLSVSESNGSLTVAADGDQAWSATFVPKVSSGPIGLGLYRDAVLTPSKNTTRNTMKVQLTRGPTGATSCTTADGWFAVDELARTGSTITSATLRFAYSCDGTNILHGKFRWNASDPTPGPGPVQPVPDGLWDVTTPDGAAEDWVHLEADAGDPVSGGIAEVVVSSLYPPFVGDWENTLVLFAGEGDEGWMGTFERPGDGLVEPGFYPNLSSSTWASPVKGGLDLERSDGTRCATEITGWFVVDSIERIDGQITKLDLRFEQSCGGATPLRGKVHIEDRTPPTTSTTTAPSTTTTTATPPLTSTTTTPPLVLGLLPGSPQGSIDMAAGGAGVVRARGWALDPETVSPISIRVSLDGQGSTFSADEPRPDVESAFPGYGPRHGFDLSLPATPGTHRVCVSAVDQGVGSNKGLGCRDVNVPSGSPFGSLDSVVGGIGALRVTGWAIDPDTELPVRVRVLVDGVATAVVAGSRRPDVGAAFPGYGPMHGFSRRMVATKGTHTVCVSAIDVGPGSNTSLGCRTVKVR